MPIKADKATFFTPSSYTVSVKEAGPKTLSEEKHYLLRILHSRIQTFNNNAMKLRVV